ncbi:MAG: hypothetical protein ABI305_01545, partial [Tepidiformaceae bacterium]
MSQHEPPALGTRVRRAWRVSARIGLHEIVLSLILFLIYFYIRGLVVGRAGEAMVRGFNVITLEKNLGLY